MESMQTEIVVIGAGPGGYAAAFYAAAHGKKVALVERDAKLGGTCLHRGCIPSKALLHIAKLIRETSEAEKCGVLFQKPVVQLEKLRNWKDSVLEKLSQGIANLAGRRNVQVIQGAARFEDARTLRVETPEGPRQVKFDKAVIAAGSRAALPPLFDIKDPRVMTSTEALVLQDIPKKLLVVGGGYIGMELGTVYAALGSEVTVAEALNGILLGADPDLVRLVQERASKTFKDIKLNTKITGLKPLRDGVEVQTESGNAVYDRVLVSVGRVPASQDLGLEKTKVRIHAKGFVEVSAKQQTSEPGIYAIGDVTGGMMLAHKASSDARIAVDALLGDKETKKPSIPAVVFTDPEVAWCGLTEGEAKEKNIQVQIVKFPWSASGRALTLERPDGVTKLLVDPQSEKILGVGICGVGAGELISEGVLAVEAGLKAKDLGRIVHPHPTLSETLMECAEMFYGHAAHAYSRKRGS
ncbi:MAG TPA: dihydrolipoyl dehydrogenase [Candidatus Omnitrophota bacterium]|nr:dihydrolipoyl dehydrogenase [Candidatus Omnitrophota bacterium]